MPKKWPNLESLLKNEGKAISWRGSNGKIFHLALGNTSNRAQKGAIYNCCLAVCGALSVSLGPFLSSPLPRVPSLMCLCSAGRMLLSALCTPAPRGSGEVEGCKQAQNSAPHTVVSFPHMCSASPGVQRLWDCVTAEGDLDRVRAHWILDHGQYLVWSFPYNKIGSKWRQKCCQIKKVQFHLHFTLT